MLVSPLGRWVSIKVSGGTKRLLEAAVFLERAEKKRRVSYDEVIRSAILQVYGDRVADLVSLADEAVLGEEA